MDGAIEQAVAAVFAARGIYGDEEVFSDPTAAWGRSTTRPTPVATLYEGMRLVPNDQACEFSHGQKPANT